MPNILSEMTMIQTHFGQYAREYITDRNRNIARYKQTLLNAFKNFDGAVSGAHPDHIIHDILSVIEENMNSQYPPSAFEMKEICQSIFDGYCEDLQNLEKEYNCFNNWDYALYLDDWNGVLQGQQDVSSPFDLNKLPIPDMISDIAKAAQIADDRRDTIHDQYDLLHRQIERFAEWWNSPQKTKVFESYKFLRQLKPEQKKAFNWGQVSLNHG